MVYFRGIVIHGYHDSSHHAPVLRAKAKRVTNMTARTMYRYSEQKQNVSQT